MVVLFRSTPRGASFLFAQIVKLFYSILIIPVNMQEKRKKILSAIFVSLGLFVFVLFPQIVSAEQGDGCNPGNFLPSCTCTGNCRIEDILVLGVNIFQVAISLLGVLAVAFIIFGGIVLLTSGGNTQRVDKGKSIISGTFLGGLIVVGSWFLVNTIYYVATGGSNSVFGDQWFALKEYPPIEIITPIYGHDDEGNAVVITPECSNLSTVAQAFGTLYPAADSSALTALRTCIEANINMAMVDTSQIYTIDRTHMSCNYTRGQNICESCSHSVYSCHYGGRTGSQGAMGVDYNARSGYSEGQLFNEINAAATGPCDQYVSFVLFEDNHTHLSATGCPN